MTYKRLTYDIMTNKKNVHSHLAFSHNGIIQTLTLLSLYNIHDYSIDMYDMFVLV